VYDALTSHRPYRPALSPDQAARHVLQEAAQGKFARDHVETFLNIAEVAVLPTV
jgi:HD-GYP domain-containing protein (c-di-GMP phosphodiesterase class II)